MARKKRLTPAERDEIAATAAQRYTSGETWEQIAEHFELSGGYIRRFTVASHEITYRRWGRRPVADPQEVCRRRDEGQTLGEIAEALGCSRQAVRTALEASGRRAPTRYPRLSTRRRPTSAELELLNQLYEACPLAPRARPGAHDIRGGEGRTLAEACRALIDDGVPMETLSRDLGRGATWIHWLLGIHALHPDRHRARPTSRRTRRMREGADS